MVIGRGKHKIKIEGMLAVVYFKEADAFVAYSPALDLSSYGSSFQEAKDNFRETLDIFFDDLIKRGTLEDVLEEYGWEKIEKPTLHWSPPAFIGEESIPLEPLITEQSVKCATKLSGWRQPGTS